MYDQFERKIDYLRISVTDRCNLRCTYCMPAEGIQLLGHSDILTFDEIVSFTKSAISFGVSKVRITGGEPLVRRGIVDLVSAIAELEGIEDLSMTTNGTLLGHFAKSLKAAGMKRVNISLDTIDPVKYGEITRGGNLFDALRGVETAIAEGFDPVKINCVVSVSRNEIDAGEVEKYAKSVGAEVRFIKQMDLENGHFGVVDGGTGGNCTICNRIRLTANGNVKPCLFNNLEYNIRRYGNDEAIRLALKNKPVCGTTNSNGSFYNIGG